MALRFQKKDDVDREVSERRRDPLWGIVIGGALYLSIRALLGWIGWGKGESLKSYGEDVVWLIAIGFLFWLVSPLYYEFRIRTKEIDGKVSAIEAAVNTHREGQRSETEPFNANKVMEKLAAIEERQTSFRRNWRTCIRVQVMLIQQAEYGKVCGQSTQEHLR